MNPILNEPFVHDRMMTARQRAETWRAHRAARGCLGPTGPHSMRRAVGNGLIAMGERIASRPTASDSPPVRKAA